jgi:hypothetical protein
MEKALENDILWHHWFPKNICAQFGETANL